jgi:putative transposase
VEQDRQMAIDLIEEAVSAGARRFKACEVLEIDVRTLQRWNKTLAEEKRLVDQRKAAASERIPANKLSNEEREAILSVCSKPEFQSLPPSQIVPRLADNGEYIASESSFYRVLRDARQLEHRQASRPATVRHKPKTLHATAPNQLYSWDITYRAPILRRCH